MHLTQEQSKLLFYAGLLKPGGRLRITRGELHTWLEGLEAWKEEEYARLDRRLMPTTASLRNVAQSQSRRRHLSQDVSSYRPEVEQG